jgi:YtkA-like protein
MMPTRGVLAVVLVASSLAIGCNGSQEPAQGGVQVAAGGGAGVISGDLNIAFTSNPDPPKNGDNAIEVTVTDRGGAPVTDATVEAEFMMPAMPSMNMPAMRSAVTLGHQSAGRYTGTGQLSMAGTWTTTISVSRGGQRVATRRFSVVAN